MFYLLNIYLQCFVAKHLLCVRCSQSFLFNEKRGEVSVVQLCKGRKHKSDLQLIGKAKPSVLGLLSLLSAKSLAGYLFVCVADPSLWCLAGLGFEGKLNCLLVIWEGHTAFPDLV